MRHGSLFSGIGGFDLAAEWMAWENVFHCEWIKDKQAQTVGEQRVRTSLNPSQTDTVALIKQKSAELINLCEELKAKDGRLASLAQTSYEEAAMWAVKAATA